MGFRIPFGNTELQNGNESAGEEVRRNLLFAIEMIWSPACDGEMYTTTG